MSHYVSSKVWYWADVDIKYAVMEASYIKPELSPKIIQTNEPILVTEIVNLQEFSVTSVVGQAQQILSKLRKIQTPKVCVRGQSNRLAH